MATLIEALKSGRRFRRDSTCFWFEAGDWSTDARGIHFDITDVLFDGWIIEQPKNKPREWSVLLNSSGIIKSLWCNYETTEAGNKVIKVREVLEEEGLY